MQFLDEALTIKNPLKYGVFTQINDVTGSAPPPESFFRITDDNNRRITDSGNNRIID